MGDRADIAYASMAQGSRACFRGEFARSHTLCEESLVLSKEMGHTWLIATNLHYLGWALFLQGAYVGARRLSQESLARFKGLVHAVLALEAPIRLTDEERAPREEIAAQAL